MLLPYAEARELLRKATEALAPERVSLDACDGRVLVERLAAPADLPAFDHSAMDGYALRSDWCAGTGPWSLPVHGESRAGVPLAELRDGHAGRIFTGARLPAGADCVLLQENVRREGDHIHFSHVCQPSEHVRRAGTDIRSGQVAIDAGTRLTPGHVSLLGAFDHAFAYVTRRARVVLASTGDELRLPSSQHRDGSIAESNSFGLAAQCRRLGASPRVLPYVADDAAGTREALGRALASSDLLITVGGASVGDHDLVKPALTACGVEWIFSGVALKPGKPVALGRKGKSFVLCLPGNPASAAATFSVFGAPLLRGLHGQQPLWAPLQKMAVVGERKRRPGRTELMRARIVWHDGVPKAELLTRQSSGAVTAFARADALVVVPAERPAVADGDQLEVLQLRDSWQ